MGYERYPRGTNPQGDYYNRDDTQDYGQDYGSGRRYSFSSARDYQAAGRLDRDDDRDDRGRGRDRYGAEGYRSQGSGSQGYGRREYGNAGYARDYNRSERDDERSNYGSDYGRSSYGRSDYGQSRQYGGGGGGEYHGSYGSDGRRFVDVGDRSHWDDDNYGRNQERGDDRGRYGNDRNRYGGNDRGDTQRGGNYGRAPQGYDYQDRGFMARAGDEVRSWFGDEEAERRREADSRYDEREYNQRDRHDRDSDYHHWRSGQIAALDRDYDEYRSENRTKFHNEFGTWRANRQTQRDSLDKVQEHAEVVGSDGSHVGTVDKVRDDRILLTKNDVDAGGQHHSIPSSWIQSVEDKKVTLSKTADEAKRQWRDEENKQAMFGYGDRTSDNRGGQRSSNQQRSSSGVTGYGSGESTSGQNSTAASSGSASSATDDGDTNLNNSFSGTYQNK